MKGRVDSSDEEIIQSLIASEILNITSLELAAMWLGVATESLSTNDGAYGFALYQGFWIIVNKIADFRNDQTLDSMRRLQDRFGLEGANKARFQGLIDYLDNK